MRKYASITFFLCCFLWSASQNVKLAQQYYNDGEYEKASVIFQKLYKAHGNNTYYFDKFVDCLLNLERFEECERHVEKEMKSRPADVNLYVTYGNLLERQIKHEEADKQYQKAIQKLPAEKFVITKLANAFITLTKYDLSAQTYERGSQLLKNSQVFAYNQGDLYRRMGDAPKMIHYYLNSVSDNPTKIVSLKTVFQRYLNEDDFLELQAQLYDRIQENDFNTHYTELLVWVFIQKKDYANALRQVKALDRKLSESGNRVYQLGQVALNDQDYASAIGAFEYIVLEKGETSPLYLKSKRMLLQSKKMQLVSDYDYSDDDVRSLEQEYEAFWMNLVATK